MASTDARPVPIKNTAYRVTFPILDADGDFVTGAAGLDSEVSQDGGAFADCTNEATEIGSSGLYTLDLTSTEMNADTVAVIVKTSTTGAKTTPIVLYPQETGDIPVRVQDAAADSLTAASLAADAVTEIQSGLATAAAVTALAAFVDTEIAAILAAVDTEVAAILADTNELQTDWTDGGRLDLILDGRASQASVDTVDGNVDAILVDTAEIGAAGAGLTAVPWNAAWDAEVESEAADALAAYDPPTHAELTAGLAAADDATLAAIGALNDLSAAQVNAEVDTALADAALATAANLATVAGYLDTEVAAIKAKTDALPASPAATGDAMTLTTGERTAVADALLDRDMSTGTDSGSTTVRTVRQALRALRNKVALVAGTLTVYRENDSTVDWSASVTSDANAEPVTEVNPAGGS